ncbi:MAG TPA: extracellular solute-binding protein [Clostridiaceae bacterium]|nr:extracellular solute-binding protein [Clostridiaceae bacterium]
MHKTSRLEFIIIAIIFILIFLVTWTYFFPAPLSDADYIKDSTPVTLRVVSYSLNNELQGLQIENFLEDNPGTKLKIETYPMELYYNLLTSELVNSNCPDIIMIEHPAVIDNLIPSNDLISLNNHMISSYQINDDLMHENSHYLSPPTGINSYVIYCNKDILSSLSINLDNPTFEEFVQICKKVKSSGFTPIALGARSWLCIRNIAVQLASIFTQDPWQSAMNNLSSLKPYFQEDAYLNDYHDAQVAFTQGNACFYFGMENEKEKITSACNFTPLTINLIIDGKCTIWYDYTGMYALSMKSKNKLTALNLLKHITNKNEHKITQDYLSSIVDLNNNENCCYKCNWMYNDNGKNIKMYIENLMNYTP